MCGVQEVLPIGRLVWRRFSLDCGRVEVFGLDPSFGSLALAGGSEDAVFDSREEVVGEKRRDRRPLRVVLVPEKAIGLDDGDVEELVERRAAEVSGGSPSDAKVGYESVVTVDVLRAATTFSDILGRSFSRS